MLEVDSDALRATPARTSSPADTRSVSSAFNGLPPARPRKSRFSSLENEELYLPPFRVAELQRRAGDRELSAREKQRLSWEKLRKGINGIVNRANKLNASECVVNLFNLNIIRGMGLFCRSFMRSQLVSNDFTAVFAAIIAAVNTRIPEIGELILCRLIAQLNRGIDESDRGACISSIKFIAHLFNQSVVDALLPLEIMNVLVVKPTNDSVELLVIFMKECGCLLLETEPMMVDDLFQILRKMIQEGEVDNRIQFLVEELIALRRNSFSDFPPMSSELDLVVDDERIIHAVSFTEDHNLCSNLDNFACDDEWDLAEMRYIEFRHAVLADDDNLLFEGLQLGVCADDHIASDGEQGTPLGTPLQTVGDRRIVSVNEPDTAVGSAPLNMTEDDLVSFRRKVYLIIMSAASYEECAHKLVGLMRSRRSQEGELCNMILECCSQERTFMRYYGLLGQRFCFLNKIYKERFEEAFAVHYATIHRYDSRKIRNLANFYAFLLCSEALPLTVLGVVFLSLEETTSSSRIFLKYLFVEMAQTLTVAELNARFHRPDVGPYVLGLFPTENLENIRFAIDMFTSIGLGALTDDLRERLQAMLANQNSTNVDKAAIDGDAEGTLSSSSSSLSSSSSSVLSDDDSDYASNATYNRHESRTDGARTRKPSTSLSPPRSFIRSKRSRLDSRAALAAKLTKETVVENRASSTETGHRRFRDEFDDSAPSLSRHGAQTRNLEQARGVSRGRGRSLTIPAWVDREQRPRASFAPNRLDSPSDARGTRISQQLSPRHEDVRRGVEPTRMRESSMRRRVHRSSSDEDPFVVQHNGHPEKRRRIQYARLPDRTSDVAKIGRDELSPERNSRSLYLNDQPGYLRSEQEHRFSEPQYRRSRRLLSSPDAMRSSRHRRQAPLSPGRPSLSQFRGRRRSTDCSRTPPRHESQSPPRRISRMHSQFSSRNSSRYSSWTPSRSLSRDSISSRSSHSSSPASCSQSPSRSSVHSSSSDLDRRASRSPNAAQPRYARRGRREGKQRGPYRTISRSPRRYRGENRRHASDSANLDVLQARSGADSSQAHEESREADARHENATDSKHSS